MPRTRPSKTGAPGFSLFELILVMFLIGLLALMVVPNLRETLPASRVNTEARRLSAFLRQARLKAANTQKAVRVSINCIAHFATTSGDREPCRGVMEAAYYEGGEFKDWRQIRDGQVEFHSRFNIKACNANCSLIIPGSSLDDDLVWMVFAPSSQVHSDLGPTVNLSTWYGDHERGGNAYDLALNMTSGRVTMVSASH